MKTTLTSILFLLASFLFSEAAFAQVQFFANFENGSIGEVKQVHAKKIAEQNPDKIAKQTTDTTQFSIGITDSIEQLRFHISTRPDPFNPASPNLQPSRRWFYFLMTGVKNKEIILDIEYNDSKRPFYSYDGVNFIRFNAEEVPVENKSITKRYEQDSVYISYFIPYTESYLNRKIAQWATAECVEIMNIGKSEYGREMPLLRITNKGDGKGNRQKKIVYIHGRVHPSESPASWHLDKMIDLLTSNIQYANDLRNNAVFYILPFANPDGVHLGMSRSNANGINLEVNWADSTNVTSQEVKNIRTFLQQLTSEGKPVDLFMNMHSQISPNITYWIHNAESTSGNYYKELMLLANLTIHANTYFGKGDLSFSKVNSRYLEGWFWDRFQEKTLAATFETPYTYYNQNPDGKWVTVANLQESAINNLYAIGDYLGLGKTNRMIIDNPKRGDKTKIRKDTETIYFGNSYLVSRCNTATVKFRSKHLNEGTYEIYMWNAGSNLTTSRENENEWVKKGEYTQKKSGQIKYIYKSTNTGEKIDALLFIRKPIINKETIHVQ
ncbi:MAG: M14 family zinc carboxypeptidase [Bacteroidales bacterium]